MAASTSSSESAVRSTTFLLGCLSSLSDAGSLGGCNDRAMALLICSSSGSLMLAVSLFQMQRIVVKKRHRSSKDRVPGNETKMKTEKERNIPIQVVNQSRAPKMLVDSVEKEARGR